MTKKIRVLVCDDHALFREGVRTVLAGAGDIEVIGEAANGIEAVDLARRLEPDVILMDIAMPVLRGFDATRRIKRILPDARVLILTVYDDEDVVARCMESGAFGYLVKDSPPAQLIYAVQAAARGEHYVSPRVMKSVVGHFTHSSENAKSEYDLLSDREREVLVLLAEGCAMKEIAQRLNLSVKTVDAHKYKLMRKLDVHDRPGLIRYAIRKKLIPM